MRINLDKKHYTKAERILGRLLQENRIPFKTKQILNNREIDFLIEGLAVEVDGHTQVESKNEDLMSLDYLPLHFLNQDILNNRQRAIKIIINNLNGYNKNKVTRRID